MTPFDTVSGGPERVYRSGDLVRLDAAGISISSDASTPR